MPNNYEQSTLVCGERSPSHRSFHRSVIRRSAEPGNFGPSLCIAMNHWGETFRTRMAASSDYLSNPEISSAR